jgi:hypothetical protein
MGRYVINATGTSMASQSLTRKSEKAKKVTLFLLGYICLMIPLQRTTLVAFYL